MKISSPIQQQINPQHNRRRTDANRTPVTDKTTKAGMDAAPQRLPVAKDSGYSTSAKPRNQQSYNSTNLNNAFLNNALGDGSRVARDDSSYDKITDHSNSTITYFQAQSAVSQGSIVDRVVEAEESSVERVNARQGKIGAATYRDNQLLDLRDSVNEVIGIDTYA